MAGMKSMRMSSWIAGRSRRLASLILIVCPIVVMGQASTTDTKCPLVSVSCVGHCTESPFYFVATVTEADPNLKFSYHWTVQRATIIAGHGTSMIKVDGENGLVATVELKGLPAACKNTKATVALIWDPPPPVRQVDEFGSIPFERVKPYLDKLAHNLRNFPGASGSIVATRKWVLETKALNYLVTKHNLEPGRILYVEKTEKGPIRVKTYIVPQGAVPPN